MGKRRRSAKREAASLVSKNSARSAFLRVCVARVATGVRATLRGTFTQAQLALEMGVAAELIRELMQECYMPEQVRLDYGTGNLVATHEGRAKIRELLDARLAATKGAPPSPTAAPANGAETLIVSRQWGAKRVRCVREESGLEVTCQVQKSENLRAGMKLEGAQPGEGGLWFYLGKLPRRPGRW